jgi:hypothetical protein
MEAVFCEAMRKCGHQICVDLSICEEEPHMGILDRFKRFGLEKAVRVCTAAGPKVSNMV